MFFYNESDSELSSVDPPTSSSDPHFSDTSLLLKMDSDFSDSSLHQHTVTVNGNSTISSTESKYGGGSGYFDGNTNTGVSFPSSDSLDLRGVDWTMEAWIKPDGDYSDWRIILSKRYSTGHNYEVYLDINSGNIIFTNGSGSNFINTNTSPTINQWSHLAVVRHNGLISVYLNGISLGSASFDTFFTSDNLGIGVSALNGRHSFSGYIDDVRITKGVARYTANFTPPTEAHPTTGPVEIVSTDLQLHLDAGNTNSYSGTGTDWLDLSGNGNDAVLVSNPTFTTTVGGEFSGFGVYGSGGYARIAHNSSIAPTSQITFSAWAHADDWSIAINSGPRQIASKTQSGGYALGADPAGVVGLARIGSSYKTLKSLPSPGWHNLTYTYDGATVTLYIDGVSMGTLSSSGNISYASSNALLIGREAGSGTTPQSGFDWPGKVATFMLYDRGLTSAEVLQNFEATKSRFGL